MSVKTDPPKLTDKELNTIFEESAINYFMMKMIKKTQEERKSD